MITFYRDKAGKWRWRIVGGNGEIVGASSQGFSRHIDAWRNLTLISSAYEEWKKDNG